MCIYVNESVVLLVRHFSRARALRVKLKHSYVNKNNTQYYSIEGLFENDLDICISFDNSYSI